jgi:hypothetical protein
MQIAVLKPRCCNLGQAGLCRDGRMGFSLDTFIAQIDVISQAREGRASQSEMPQAQSPIDLANTYVISQVWGILVQLEREVRGRRS